MLIRGVCHLADVLRPGGGPSGYLWNLQAALSASTPLAPVSVFAPIVLDERAPIPSPQNRLLDLTSSLLPPQILDQIFVRREAARCW